MLCSLKGPTLWWFRKQVPPPSIHPAISRRTSLTRCTHFVSPRLSSGRSWGVGDPGRMWGVPMPCLPQMYVPAGLPSTTWRLTFNQTHTEEHKTFFKEFMECLLKVGWWSSSRCKMMMSGRGKRN